MGKKGLIKKESKRIKYNPHVIPVSAFIFIYMYLLCCVSTK